MIVRVPNEDQMTQESLAVLTAIAKSMQLNVVDSNEFSMLMESIDELNDVVIVNEQKNIVRLNKQAKLSQLKGAAAITIAREKADPMYAKWKKMNTMAKAMKKQMQKKYQQGSTQRAKAILQHVNKSSAIDMPKGKLN